MTQILYGAPSGKVKSKRETIFELELTALKLKEEIEANPKDPFSRNMLENVENRLSRLKEETDGKE